MVQVVWDTELYLEVSDCRSFERLNALIFKGEEISEKKISCGISRLLSDVGTLLLRRAYLRTLHPHAPSTLQPDRQMYI
jgi:hypothetical protein